MTNSILGQKADGMLQKYSAVPPGVEKLQLISSEMQNHSFGSSKKRKKTTTVLDNNKLLAILHTRTSLTDSARLVRKDTNPINRLLLEVTFSFIIITGRPLAAWLSGHDRRHLKRRQIEIGYG